MGKGSVVGVDRAGCGRDVGRWGMGGGSAAGAAVTQLQVRCASRPRSYDCVGVMMIG